MTGSHATGEPQSGPDAASGFDPASLHFTTLHVTAAERAATTAVIGGLLEQESALLGHAPGHGATAWQRSQRPLRTAFTPGHNRWSRPPL